MLSAADVHDALFAFVRRRVREGKGLGAIQAEVDASTRVPPRGGGGGQQQRRRREQGKEEAGASVVVEGDKD